MSKFRVGSPQIRFRRKDGKSFIKTFHTRGSAAKAFKAWRSKGGKVLGVGVFQGRSKVRITRGMMSRQARRFRSRR